MVVVVDGDKSPQSLVPSQRSGLVADALGQIPVAANHVSEVIAKFGPKTGPQVAFCYGHTDGIGEALAQRPGGYLDPCGVSNLGVARSC